MGCIKHLGKWVFRHFVFLLFAAYVLAAVIPAPGLWLKNLDWGSLPGQGGRITSSLIMLGILLFNAGFSVNTEHLNALRQRPLLSFIGLLGKGSIALVWICLLKIASTMGLSTLWISMLTGFAIVSMMPVATSSTAWAQQSNANMALSLGLLLLSTSLIPLILPLMSWMLGELPSNLHAPFSKETNISFSLPFMVIWIIIPVVVGRTFRWLAGENRQIQLAVWIKWGNAVNLLLLNYMHGASFLPQRFDPFQPAPVLSLLFGVLVCCTLAFLVGGWLGKSLKVTHSEKMALLFGTGMNNNGMALVLASQFLGESGWIGLTIALCTFGQHLVAGAVLGIFGKSDGESLDSPNVFTNSDNAKSNVLKHKTTTQFEDSSALLVSKTESNPPTP